MTAKRMPRWGARSALAILAVLVVGPVEGGAQVPADSEVRQLVTFRFQPGGLARALDIYRERVVPLYRRDEAMLNLRAFREVESPVPLDLIIVRGFRGMDGMDRSNEGLRAISERGGASIGALYGAISAEAVGHDDQFVEMLEPFANGDPSSKALVAMVWYRAAPGQARVLRRALERELLPWERERGIPSATGRFLISDGWDFLRFIGFDSLGEYEEYVASPASERVHDYSARRRQVIVAPMPELSIR